MTETDSYLLGRADAEVERLTRQIVTLGSDSEAQLDRIGIKHGEKVVDLGCGPGGVLHLLAERVGRTGHVLGIDRGRHFVELAQGFVKSRGLTEVEVREGDAYDTGLPRASFDGGHMRLLLVNVPEPERAVRELVALVRPGGWVASFEADYLPCCCDPPLPALDRLMEAYAAYARAQKIDLSVGRRMHRMFREAGVTDISVDAIVHVFPEGHERRWFQKRLIDNVRERMLEGGFVTRDDLARDMAALEAHLARPDVQVMSNLFFRLTGRVARAPVAARPH
jgi:ubiquinone/menaquinone biosynthesis C-methylase UbiE